MKNKSNRIQYIISIILLCYGFSDGMEWYRLLSCAIGSILLASSVENFK